MNRRTVFSTIIVLGLVAALGGGTVLTRRAEAQESGPQGVLGPQGNVGTGFTYQGRLLDSGAGVDGTCDFRFGLYGDGLSPSLVAGPVDRTGVAVSEGNFSTSIDFGATVFTGEGRQLEIAVRCPAGSGSYTTLSGMVPLSAAPYAHSLRPGASVQSPNGNALNLSTAATAGAALSATASKTTGDAAAVYGTSSSSSGAGISGYNDTSGYGVYGSAAGTTGTPYGVYGLASNVGSATSYGVYGKSNSSVGTGVGGEAPKNGVYGQATAGSGTNYGVYGRASSGYGVYGLQGSESGQLAFGAGVRGDSADTIGIYGTSATATGVAGRSSSGAGVIGNSDSGTGVQGISAGSTGSPYGVHGLASDSGNPTSYGVWGKSNSSLGTGVGGEAPMTGVYGKSTDSNGYGVYGEAAAGSGTNYGVYGKATSPFGRGLYGEGGYYGVYAVGTDPTGLSMGVYGKTDTTGTGYGVYGVADSTTAGYGGYFRALSGTGLFAEGDTTSSGVDVRLGGDDGSIAADENASSSLQLHSNAEIHFHLDQDNTDTVSEFEIFSNGDLASIFEIDQDGNLFTAGDLSAGGTKPATVDTAEYGKRRLYAVESPEVWFEDFGTGTLASGVVTIPVEPIFAETVNMESYHVFLTALGDCNGLYVAAKTAEGFVVRELGGGTSSVSFDYRVVAKRLGYEGVRLEEVAP